MSNKLIIGLADKTAELLPAKPGFLLIDDGPVADAFLQKFERAKQFAPHSHSFNLLPMTYRKPTATASSRSASCRKCGPSQCYERKTMEQGELVH
jgi:hypothetical protein